VHAVEVLEQQNLSQQRYYYLDLMIAIVFVFVFVEVVGFGGGGLFSGRLRMCLRGL
jgi:hypothetical protein